MSTIQTLREANNRKPWSKRILFISGRLSLDLAQTGGPGPYQRFERIHTLEELALWLAISDLSLKDPYATQADLRRTHKLREAIWDAANAFRQGQIPTAGDIEIINKIAAIPPLVPKLDLGGGQRAWASPVTAKAALSTIARDAIDLFADREQLPIHQCAGPDCPLLFVDSSRAGKRKWCAMERCGNRAKVAKHRKKT